MYSVVMIKSSFTVLNSISIFEHFVYLNQWLTKSLPCCFHSSKTALIWLCIFAHLTTKALMRLCFNVRQGSLVEYSQHPSSPQRCLLGFRSRIYAIHSIFTTTLTWENCLYIYWLTPVHQTHTTAFPKLF